MPANQGAVEGYALLKVTGDKQGLDSLVMELGGRFARRSRKPGNETELVTTPSDR